jgi:hypothetical protein
MVKRDEADRLDGFDEIFDKAGIVIDTLSLVNLLGIDRFPDGFKLV